LRFVAVGVGLGGIGQWIAIAPQVFPHLLVDALAGGRAQHVVGVEREILARRAVVSDVAAAELEPDAEVITFRFGEDRVADGRNVERDGYASTEIVYVIPVVQEYGGPLLRLGAIERLIGADLRFYTFDEEVAHGIGAEHHHHVDGARGLGGLHRRMYRALAIGTLRRHVEDFAGHEILLDRPHALDLVVAALFLEDPATFAGVELAFEPEGTSRPAEKILRGLRLFLDSLEVNRLTRHGLRGRYGHRDREDRNYRHQQLLHWLPSPPLIEVLGAKCAPWFPNNSKGYFIFCQ